MEASVQSFEKFGSALHLYFVWSSELVRKATCFMSFFWTATARTKPQELKQQKCDSDIQRATFWGKWEVLSLSFTSLTN